MVLLWLKGEVVVFERVHAKGIEIFCAIDCSEECAGGLPVFSATVKNCSCLYDSVSYFLVNTIICSDSPAERGPVISPVRCHR